MATRREGAGLLPAYLAVGADELKRRRSVERLEAHLDEQFRDFNLDEREAAADLTAEDLLASLQALPFGPGPRLVVVRRAEKLPKPVSEAVVSYLKDPNPTTVLLLVAESLAKGTRLYKAVAALGPKAVVDCSAKRRSELPALVSRMAASRGKTMSADAASELVSLVGESTVMLDTQVRTLCELVGDADEVTLDDVRTHVRRVAEVKPWDFLDAVSARDLPRALELYSMMPDPSQVFLLSLVTGRLRELVCAKSLGARGESALVAEALGRKEWQVRRLPGWARRFSDEELAGCFRLCADAERALKGGADADATLVRLVARVCGRTG